jgi:acetylglutamate kinase
VSAAAAGVVLKCGGELIEDEAHLGAIVSAIERIAGAGVPLVLVHGGGREIDAALEAAGIEKRQVDGLRITDQATLDIVVAVLAGVVNTRLVARLNKSGVAGVGLTGVDGRCGLSRLAPPHVTAKGGQPVDLGRVGLPVENADVRLLETLVRDRFVPVIASIGVDERGWLLNVNADTFAGHLAARLHAKRLIMAGVTAGVLGADGATVSVVDSAGIGQLVGEGTATAGMIAKLRACEHALARGVEDVLIVDGRDGPALVAAATGTTPTNATRLVPSVQV